MAKSTGRLNPAAGLFNQAQPQEKHEEQQVQYVQDEQRSGYAHELNQESTSSLKGTQGKKGHKLPRINMAFTPENHEWITRTSRRQGISATEYVNTLINEARRKHTNQ